MSAPCLFLWLACYMLEVWKYQISFTLGEDAQKFNLLPGEHNLFSKVLIHLTGPCVCAFIFFVSPPISKSSLYIRIQLLCLKVSTYLW